MVSYLRSSLHAVTRYVLPPDVPILYPPRTQRTEDLRRSLLMRAHTAPELTARQPLDHHPNKPLANYSQNRRSSSIALQQASPRPRSVTSCVCAAHQALLPFTAHARAPEEPKFKAPQPHHCHLTNTQPHTQPDYQEEESEGGEVGRRVQKAGKSGDRCTGSEGEEG